MIFCSIDAFSRAFKIEIFFKTRRLQRKRQFRAFSPVTSEEVHCVLCTLWSIYSYLVMASDNTRGGGDTWQKKKRRVGKRCSYGKEVLL